MKLPHVAVALLAVSLTVGGLANPARAQLKVPRVSPNASVSQTIGITDLAVTYCRPGVKDRPIWGALVPYGQVWRAGANEATTFTTTHPVTFGGKPLAAGRYELFVLPGTDEWQVILSDTSGQWGAFSYDSTKDVMRVPVKPATLATPQEWMEFSFEDMAPRSLTAGPAATNLVLRWEKLQIAVPVTVDVNGTTLAAMRAAIQGAKPDDWRTPYQAASFCLNSDVALDEGHGWLTKSLAVQENYSNLGLKARYQAKHGQTADAIRTGEAALALAKASKDKPDTSALEKRLAEWKAAK